MEEQWLLRHAVVDATVASSQFAKKKQIIVEAKR